MQAQAAILILNRSYKTCNDQTTRLCEAKNESKSVAKFLLTTSGRVDKCFYWSLISAFLKDRQNLLLIRNYALLFTRFSQPIEMKCIV